MDKKYCDICGVEIPDRYKRCKVSIRKEIKTKKIENIERRILDMCEVCEDRIFGDKGFVYSSRE